LDPNQVETAVAGIQKSNLRKHLSGKLISLLTTAPKRIRNGFVVSWRRSTHDSSQELKARGRGISADGDLILKSGHDELVQRRPIIYQESMAERRLVDGQYSLRRHAGLSDQISNMTVNFAGGGVVKYCPSSEPALAMIS